ncbi:MAG: FtsX-like permease family protein [Bryobacteraceae bacterium]
MQPSGLYGVMSYNVGRRRGEIGIRIALEAQVHALRWMVLRESLLLLVIGVGVGLSLTVASKHLISHQLFGVSSLDPITYAVALVVVSAMTLFASWVPARDGGKVDPMVALRADWYIVQIVLYNIRNFEYAGVCRVAPLRLFSILRLDQR